MGVSSATSIANYALTKLGQDSITTLADGTRDATICNRVYDQNRDYCLDTAGISTGTAITAYNPSLIEFMSTRLAWCVSTKIAGDDSLTLALLREWLMYAAQVSGAETTWVKVLVSLFGNVPK